MGLEASGLERLIQKAYSMLGLISFLTAGEKEVKAWTIEKNLDAQHAAGAIHTDFIGEIATEDDPHAIAAVTLLTALKLKNHERKRINEFIDDTKFKGRVEFTRDPVKSTIVEMPPASLEEKKWFNIIDKASIGKAVKALREAGDLTQEAFALKIGMSTDKYTFIEEGKNKASIPTVNKIIEASLIDNDGLAAQRLRLKARGMDVKRISSLTEVTLGQLTRYVRTLKGLTQKELATILEVSRKVVVDIELGHPIPKSVEEDFTGWAQDEPINKIFQLKLQGMPIPNEVANTVLSGKLLFVGPLLPELA